MGRDTFKKRQKELARWEKRQKKAARRMERRSERATVGKRLQGENAYIVGIVSDPSQKTHRNWQNNPSGLLNKTESQKKQFLLELVTTCQVTQL